MLTCHSQHKRPLVRANSLALTVLSALLLSCARADAPSLEPLGVSETLGRIELEVLGEGIVRYDGRECRGVCSSLHAVPVDLVPEPLPGWRFIGFEGDCGPSTCNIKVGKARAQFQRRMGVTVAFSGTGNGRVEASNGVECSSSCFIETTQSIVMSAIARAGSRGSFETCGDPCEARPGDTTSVRFDRVRTATVKITGPGSGFVSLGGNVCDGGCSYQLPPESPFVVEARPTGLSEFEAWSPDSGCGSASTCQFAAGSDDVEVEAHFSTPVVFESNARVLDSSGPVGGVIGLASDHVAVHMYSGGLGLELRGVGQLQVPAPGRPSSNFVQFNFDGGVRSAIQLHAAPSALGGGTLVDQLGFVDSTWLGLGSCFTEWQGISCTSGGQQKPAVVLVSSSGVVIDAGVYRSNPGAMIASAVGQGGAVLVARSPTVGSSAFDSSLFMPDGTTISVPAHLAPCVSARQSGAIFCLASWLTAAPWNGCTPSAALQEVRQLIKIELSQPALPRCTVVEEMSGSLMQYPLPYAAIEVSAQEDGVWLAATAEEAVSLREAGQLLSVGEIFAVKYGPAAPPRVLRFGSTVRVVGFHESRTGEVSVLSQTSPFGSVLFGQAQPLGCQLSTLTRDGQLLKTHQFENATQRCRMVGGFGKLGLVFLGTNVMANGAPLAVPSSRRYHVIVLNEP